MIESSEIILYVADRSRSREFYRSVLAIEPSLDVAGMTEFTIGPLKLGLMPLKGIRTLLGTAVAGDDVRSARSELYFKVNGPEAYLQRALKAGAEMLSPLQSRDWGDDVAYVADPDGHVIAFAQESKP